VANKGNIVAEAVQVYLAAAGTDSGDLTLWTEVGWCEGGQTRLVEESRDTLDMNGYVLTTNIKYLFRCLALQTNSANLIALDGFDNTHVDIMLLARENTLVKYLYLKMLFSLGPDFSYSKNAASKISVEARRVACKLSDFYSRRVLTAEPFTGVL
jgi:hypothetical protein